MSANNKCAPQPPGITPEEAIQASPTLLQPGSLEGTSVSAVDPDPAAVPNQFVIDNLDAVVKSMLPPGYTVRITAGGGRHARGSTQNHPQGDAADIQIIKPDGTALDSTFDPEAQGLYERVIAGLTGNSIAAGRQAGIGLYSWGIHFDQSGWRQNGSGGVATWNGWGSNPNPGPQSVLTNGIAAGRERAANGQIATVGVQPTQAEIDSRPVTKSNKTPPIKASDGTAGLAADRSAFDPRKTNPGGQGGFFQGISYSRDDVANVEEAKKISDTFGGGGTFGDKFTPEQVAYARSKGYVKPQDLSTKSPGDITSGKSIAGGGQVGDTFRKVDTVETPGGTEKVERQYKIIDTPAGPQEVDITDTEAPVDPDQADNEATNEALSGCQSPGERRGRNGKGGGCAPMSSLAVAAVASMSKNKGMAIPSKLTAEIAKFDEIAAIAPIKGALEKVGGITALTDTFGKLDVLAQITPQVGDLVKNLGTGKIFNAISGRLPGIVSDMIGGQGLISGVINNTANKILGSGDLAKFTGIFNGALSAATMAGNLGEGIQQIQGQLFGNAKNVIGVIGNVFEAVPGMSIDTMAAGITKNLIGPLDTVLGDLVDNGEKFSAFGSVFRDFNSMVTQGLGNITDDIQTLGQDFKKLGNLANMEDLFRIGTPGQIVEQLAVNGAKAIVIGGIADKLAKNNLGIAKINRFENDDYARNLLNEINDPELIADAIEKLEIDRDPSEFKTLGDLTNPEVILPNSYKKNRFNNLNEISLHLSVCGAKGFKNLRDFGTTMEQMESFATNDTMDFEVGPVTIDELTELKKGLTPGGDYNGDGSLTVSDFIGTAAGYRHLDGLNLQRKILDELTAAGNLDLYNALNTLLDDTLGGAYNNASSDPDGAGFVVTGSDFNETPSSNPSLPDFDLSDPSQYPYEFSLSNINTRERLVSETAEFQQFVYIRDKTTDAVVDTIDIGYHGSKSSLNDALNRALVQHKHNYLYDNYNNYPPANLGRRVKQENGKSTYTAKIGVTVNDAIAATPTSLPKSPVEYTYADGTAAATSSGICLPTISSASLGRTYAFGCYPTLDAAVSAICSAVEEEMDYVATEADQTKLAQLQSIHDEMSHQLYKEQKLRNQYNINIDTVKNKKEFFGGDGSTAVFTLAGDVGEDDTITVYIDDVKVNYWTFDDLGKTVTFDRVPTDGAVIEIEYAVKNPPADGSVGDIWNFAQNLEQFGKETGHGKEADILRRLVTDDKDGIRIKGAMAQARNAERADDAGMPCPGFNRVMSDFNIENENGITTVEDLTGIWSPDPNRASEIYIQQNFDYDSREEYIATRMKKEKARQQEVFDEAMTRIARKLVFYSDGFIAVSNIGAGIYNEFKDTYKSIDYKFAPEVFRIDIDDVYPTVGFVVGPYKQVVSEILRIESVPDVNFSIELQEVSKNYLKSIDVDLKSLVGVLQKVMISTASMYLGLNENDIRNIYGVPGVGKYLLRGIAEDR